MPGTFVYNRSTKVLDITGGTAGAPARFSGLYQADLNGDLQLMAPAAPVANMNLDIQIQPADWKVLRLRFILVGTGAGAGDTIVVDGYSQTGEKIIETISVAGGNGTYYTTYSFKQMEPNGIDCVGAGFAGGPGTVEIKQDRWGICTEVYTDAQYYLHSVGDVGPILEKINFGDGTTSTYFISRDECITFEYPSAWELHDNATLKIGVKNGNRGTNGSFWFFGFVGDAIASGNTPSLYIYGSIIISQDPNGNVDFHDQTVIEIIDSFFQGYARQWGVNNGGIRFIDESSSGVSIKNTSFIGFRGVQMPLGVFEDVIIAYARDGIWVDGLNLMIEGLLIEDCDLEDIVVKTGNEIRLRNPLYVITTPVIQHADGKVRVEFTCDIHVVDKDGGNLPNVTIVCKDKYDNIVFTQTTTADGTITQQVIDYKLWEGTSEILTEYPPHKFIFIHADYPELIMSNVTVDEAVDWEVDMGQSTSDLETIVAGQVAAIQAKTDNLPNDPADASDIAASFAALNDITVAEILAAVGVTEGGTWQLDKVLKIMAAWCAGNWRFKSGSTTIRELLDAEDSSTVILEMVLRQAPEAPHRSITVKI